MAIDRLDFDYVCEADLLGLVNAGAPESLTIEYKRESYGYSDADKSEALKDVSALANSSGGHLILGITEKDGVPVSVSPIAGIDSGKEVDRLENLFRSGIEPRIVGIRVRAIPFETGGFAIVVRVPKSWNPPHRVCARNSNRFFIRNSGGVHEASVDELRMMFETSGTLEEKIRNFRSNRIGKISRGESAIPIVGEGRLIIHVVPFSAYGQHMTINLEQAFEYHSSFRPIATMGMTPQFNFDGFVNLRGGEKCHGYTQVFRNGIIEATKSNMMRLGSGAKTLHGGTLGDQIFDVIPGYLNGLKKIQISPPLVVMISLEGVGGAKLVGEGMEDWLEDIPAFDRQDLLLPEIIIDDFGTPDLYQEKIRPAFDVLWNSAGYVSCTHFDANNRWKPPGAR